MSNDQSPVDQDAFDEALLNTFVTTLIFSAILLALFHLAKRFKPRYYHRNPTHPNDSRSPFSWFTKTVRYPRTKILWRHGYDAYVALSIIKLYMLLILIFAIFGIIILIPIHATGHNQYRPDNTTLVNETKIVNETIDRAECVCTCVSNYNVTTYPVNGTALITLANIYDNPADIGRMYVIPISIIWNTLWTWLLLYLAWRRFRGLRQTYRSEPKVHNYTVRLSGYRREDWTEGQLKTYLESIFGPGSIYAIHTAPAGPGVDKLKRLRKRRLEIVQHIEAFKLALAKEDNPETKQNLNIAYGRLSKIDAQIAGLMNQTSPWTFSCADKFHLCKGCCKPLTYFCARRKGRGTKDVTHKEPPELLLPTDIQLETKDSANVTFVTFRRMRDARLCARSYLAPNTHFQVSPAPTPEDVRWQNVKAPEHHLKRKCCKILGVFAFMALALFWFIPVAFAVSLTSLSALGNTFSFLRPITDGLDTVPVIRGFIEGLLPQLIIIIFYMLLIPIIKKMGDIFFRPYSNSRIDVLVMQVFFLFKVVNIFLGGIIANTFLAIWTQLALIAASPFSIVAILAASIPAQSSFFLNFVLAMGLLKACSSLARLFKVCIYAIKDKRAHTPRQKYMMRQPDPASYGATLAMHSFIMLLVFTYSTINPLILPIAMLYFASFYIVQKYNILFHNRQANEHGGFHWPTAFSQMCLALCIYHLIMLGIFIGVTFAFGIVVSVICFLLTVLYWAYFHFEWRPLTYYSSLADLSPVSPSDVDKLPEDHSEAYKHPVLRPLEPLEKEWDDQVEETLDRGDGSSMRCTRHLPK